jgi:hypothetical protein
MLCVFTIEIDTDNSTLIKMTLVDKLREYLFANIKIISSKIKIITLSNSLVLDVTFYNMRVAYRILIL